MLQITKIENGCNCYLIENKEGSILIDTGLSKGADKVLGICKDKNVKLIILTHGHMDHIQAAQKVAEKLGAPIAMHEKDMEMMDNNLSQPIHGRTMQGKILALFSSLGAKFCKIDHFEVDELISGEKTMQKCGMDLKIVELPGHTQGSIGIILENHFFVGDALMNMTGPGISLLYENREDLQKSARKITEAGEFTIHFGHGAEADNRQWA